MNINPINSAYNKGFTAIVIEGNAKRVARTLAHYYHDDKDRLLKLIVDEKENPFNISLTITQEHLDDVIFATIFENGGGTNYLAKNKEEFEDVVSIARRQFEQDRLANEADNKFAKKILDTIG